MAKALLEEIDPRLSARAREMLVRGGARRAAPRWASREALAEALRQRGIEPSEAVLAFEESFGGLAFSAGKYSFALGVRLPGEGDEEDEDEDDEDDEGAGAAEERPPVQGGLVPCGTGWSGLYRLLIGPDGAIYAEYARVYRRSASALKLVEQIAMQWSVERQRYTIRVRPPLSAELAGALDLAQLEEASDDHESWWEGADTVVLQAHVPEDARGDTTFVFTSGVERAARILEAARALRDDVGFGISDRDAVREARKIGSPAPPDMPPPEQWQAHPGARRFRHDSGQESSGEVWVVEGPEGLHIEQYRVYKGQIRGWSTFTDGGSVERSW